MRTRLGFLLWTFPRRFREQFGDGMLEVMQVDYGRARARGRVQALFFLIGTAANTLAEGLSERLAPTWIDPDKPSGGWRWKVRGVIETWTRDFMHAARSLARAPGFSLVVVTTLALAIGANTAIFSVVNPVLLEPLPFPHADRLVHIAGTAPGTDQPEELGVPDELYFEYRDSVPALEDAGLYGTGSSTTRAEGQVDQLFLTQATPSFFTTLGAQPLHGRLPTDEDDNRVVVISHWLWQSWFSSDPAVIGRSYTFAGETRAVIGVMKPEFRFPDERVAFWIPLTIRPAQVTPGGFGPRMVARLAPGTDHAGLVAQLEPLARRVQARLGGPAPYARIMERHRPVVKPLRGHLVGKISTPLWILLGTVGIVFLIACANVANLFTVRAENRRRDLAVRRALGAAACGSRRRGRRAHRLGRRPPFGPRGAGCGRRRLFQRTHSRTRHRGPRPHGAALHGGHLGSGGLRVRPAARLPPLERCAPGEPPAGRPGHRRPPESHARRAGGRADRFCPRPAGWIGAAHAQFLAAQPRRRRVRHDGHLHVPDCARPRKSQSDRPGVRIAVSV
jgi:hypothetical protein